MKDIEEQRSRVKKEKYKYERMLDEKQKITSFVSERGKSMTAINRRKRERKNEEQAADEPIAA